MAGARPRVAIFRIQAFKPSETFIRSQPEALTRWAPVFVGFKDHGLRAPGADYGELPRDAPTRLRAGLFRDLQPLIQPLRERRVRLIHAHFAPDAVYALPLARALGVPLVTTLHGFDVTRSDRRLLTSGRLPWMWSVLGRGELQREGAAFIAVSRFIAEQARAKGYPADRLHVLPIGAPLPISAAAAPEPGLIVHVGRLVDKKGTAVLIDALSRLPDGRLEIVGDGPLRAALEAQVRRLNLGERVRFHGALPHGEALALMARAAALAAPSLTARDGDAEGLPTVIVEALAAGVPVIASGEGAADAIEDGVNGFLVPPSDPEVLAERLAVLIADPALRIRLSAGARTTAEARFDIVRQTAALEALYDRAAPP